MEAERINAIDNRLHDLDERTQAIVDGVDAFGFHGDPWEKP